MACGLPIVSTNVGIVPEAFGPLQSRFIVQRSVDAFAEALRTLIGDETLRDELKAENLASIQAWDWAKRAAAIGKFFDGVLVARNERRGR
jgi:glycosyltransferase involved in cell wall biosynthesis